LKFNEVVRPCEKCFNCGEKAEMIQFDGPGNAHGFWLEGAADWSERKFSPGFEKELISIIKKVKNKTIIYSN
jgi:hypothetical protein